MRYLLRPLLCRVLLVKQLSLDPKSIDPPGLVRVTQPHEAHTVLHLRFLVRGGGEDNEIEPAEAVAGADGSVALDGALEAGLGEQLDGLEPVDGVSIQGLQ